MIGSEQLSERLQPGVGFPLASAMAENQELLVRAEGRVNGDLQRACELVEIEDCEAPKPDPSETRLAAYLILLTAQKEWFDTVCTSPDGAECYTLANVTTDSGLILMRQDKHDTVTLLHAIPGHDKQVRVSKTMYNVYENLRPIDLSIDASDKRVMAATTNRLRLINLKWHRLLREHRFTPPRDQLRVPLPRSASPQS